MELDVEMSKIFWCAIDRYSEEDAEGCEHCTDTQSYS